METLTVIKDSAEMIKNDLRHKSLGKQTKSDLYIHRSVLSELLTLHQETIHMLCANLDDVWNEHVPQGASIWNIIRFNNNLASISLMSYPQFDEIAHPPLSASIKINLIGNTVGSIDFRYRSNPPVLHRKELLVSVNYPHHLLFEQLSDAEMAQDLLHTPHVIGTMIGWQKRLQEHRMVIRNHELIKQ